MLCFYQEKVSATGRSLVQSTPTECVLLSLIRYNINSLHLLQWVGTGGQATKGRISPRKPVPCVQRSLKWTLKYKNIINRFITAQSIYTPTAYFFRSGVAITDRQSVSQSFIHSFSHSFIHSFSQSVSHPVSQSSSQSVSQSFIHSFSQSVIQSVIHSVSQSFSQSVIQSVSHSFSQSVNRPRIHSCMFQ